MRGWILVALLALLAGCAAPAAPQAVPAVTSLDRTEPVDRFPPVQRAVAASVAMHEEIDPSFVDVPFENGDNGWAPRDVQLTYHGIQDSYDEFARPVQTFVFRFPQMVFVQDNVEFTPDFHIDGHYEAHTYEYEFDVADGRLLGVADLDGHARAFSSPDFRDPFGSLPVILMAFDVFEHVGHHEIDVGQFHGHHFLYNFTTAGAWPALPGACAPYKIVLRVDPPFPKAPTDDAAGVTAKVEDSPHTLVCMEAGREVPMWAWEGTNKSSYRLQRTGPSISVPPFHGDVLPPVAYQAAPWQQVDGLVALPGPLLVPPHSDGGLWANEVAERAAALYFSPAYLKYRATSQLPYVEIAFLNDDNPFGLIEVANITLPPRIAGLQASTFMLDDGAKMHLHTVYTHPGGAEQPDMHVADPNGYDFDSLFGGVPAEKLPPLVPDGALQGQLSPLLPGVLDHLTFSTFAFDLDNDGAIDPDDFFSGWQATQDCLVKEDGWAAALDGLHGSMEVVVLDPMATHCLTQPDPPLLLPTVTTRADQQGALPGFRAPAGVPGMASGWAARMLSATRP